MKRILALTATVAATLTIAAWWGSSSAFAGKLFSPTKPMPINSMPYGQSYGEWASAWTMWAESIPADVPEDHPLWDETGEMAAKNQSGKVWFLGAPQWWGGTAERTVTIPNGKAIFFPLLQVFQADWVGWGPGGRPSPTYGFSFEELSAWAHNYLPEDIIGEMHATLDGLPLADNLFEYVAESPTPYTAYLPGDNNIWRFIGVEITGPDWPSLEIYPCLTYGYWLCLPPLSAGKHVLNFGGTIVNPDDPSEIWYQNDVTYHITVSK